MSKYYFDRLEYLNDLVRRRSSGSPAQMHENLTCLSVLFMNTLDFMYCF